ncbi:MAG: TetR/AcrR family transcriptional regulator [Novosphingobium sp.]|nr:TetR/AcrR family transcriptional regulator [Novosphingobium sp.]
MAGGKQVAGSALRSAAVDVSYNLNGQRLGRKGRDTRARIIAVAQEIIADSPEAMITLSEVARRANLRMASLYVYFADLTELILALLEPVMETAEQDYVRIVRETWDDEELGLKAREFVDAFYAFWVRHSRLLHLRYHMSERSDRRLMEHRVRSAQPVMRLLVAQMGGDPAGPPSRLTGMATVLMTGLERVVTVTTDDWIPTLSAGPTNPHHVLLEAEARLIELGIRDYRKLAAAD